MTDKRKEFQKYRKELLKKHNIQELICARCGLQKKSVHLHHLSELYKEGDNDTANLIPLCSTCHNEWDYYSYMQIDFITFLLSPSLFAIIQGIKSNISSKFVEDFFELHIAERVGNALKTGANNKEITYYDEIESQNAIFNAYPYSLTVELKETEKAIKEKTN